MRKTKNNQPPLDSGMVDHRRSRELMAIGEILDDIPEVLELVCRDLTGGRDASTGRPGLTAEQVLRVLVVKQMNGFSYDELAFHLADNLFLEIAQRLEGTEIEVTPVDKRL